MEQVHKGQLAKILVVFLLLLVIPFVSASMRTSYLYLILNLLIVVLAVDSGLIRTFPDVVDSTDVDNNKFIVNKPNITPATTSSSHAPPSQPEPPASLITTSSGRNPPAAKLKGCPSMPSLFFIGDGDEDGDFVNQEESETDEDEEEFDVSGRELFLKAEAFIGNFYRQLKIQREDSWKSIHGHLCRRPL